MYHVSYKRKLLICTAVLVLTGAVSADLGITSNKNFIPNGTSFINLGGASQTYSTAGGGMDQTGPFFQSMGTNGRSCATCHQATDGMSVSALNVGLRFAATAGTDPIFRTVDGSNCDHNVDVSSVAGRYNAYSLLRTRGLLRIAIAVPAGADYAVTAVKNPYACNETNLISQYRRPLPATNLSFLATVMWDGRESTPVTGTTKILSTNYPGSLVADLAHQSVDATTGHAQGDGARPTAAEQQQIISFEMGLYTAQSYGLLTGPLNSNGATGGRCHSRRSHFLSASTRACMPCCRTARSNRADSRPRATASSLRTFSICTVPGLRCPRSIFGLRWRADRRFFNSSARSRSPASPESTTMLRRAGW